jgi:5-methylcytosine-specific restriction endonuclease McrA
MLAEEPEPLPCPLCGRPNYFPSDHHLIPKSRGGKATKTICSDCHNAIHKFWTNKELEKTVHTVEAILADAKFAKHVAWLRKQDPRRRSRSIRSRDRGRRP